MNNNFWYIPANVQLVYVLFAVVVLLLITAYKLDKKKQTIKHHGK